MTKLPLLTALALGCLLVGCAQTHTLSDGAKIRTDHFPGFVTPSVTTVTILPAGSTNWNAPQVVSGPGLVGAAASGVAVVVPVGHHGGGDLNVNSSSSATGGAGGSASATAPRTGFPPGHNKGDKPNKGH